MDFVEHNTTIGHSVMNKDVIEYFKTIKVLIR